MNTPGPSPDILRLILKLPLLLAQKRYCSLKLPGVSVVDALMYAHHHVYAPSSSHSTNFEFGILSPDAERTGLTAVKNRKYHTMTLAFYLLICVYKL